MHHLMHYFTFVNKILNNKKVKDILVKLIDSIVINEAKVYLTLFCIKTKVVMMFKPNKAKLINNNFITLKTKI